MLLRTFGDWTAAAEEFGEMEKSHLRLSIRLVLVCSAFVALDVSAARAADLASGPTPDFAGETAPTPSGWTFTVAPYLFAAGISGDVAQFGAPTVHVNADFSDLFDHLKFGGMLATEARNGPFGIATDFIYVDVGENVTGPGPFGVTVGLTEKVFTGTALPEYRILQSSVGSLDAMAGVRVWNVTGDLKFSGGPFGGRTFNEDQTWVDGMAGVKGRVNLAPGLYLTDWGMIGAGGARVDWDLLGAVGLDVTKSFSLLAGYRAIGVDYSHDGFVFNAVEQGPGFGRGSSVLTA